MYPGSPELRAYYTNVFNFRAFWCAFGSPYRKISFTYMRPGVEEFHAAETFRDSAAFRHAVLRKLPSTIHLGPIVIREDVEREFVIDCDLNDCTVRECCGSEKVMCALCLPMLQMLCELIPTLLSCLYGWKNILTVFSGRRGVHFVVCDDQAKSMTSAARSAALTYLNGCLREPCNPFTFSYFSYATHVYAKYAGDLAEMILGDGTGKVSVTKVQRAMSRVREACNTTQGVPKMERTVFASVMAQLWTRATAYSQGMSARSAMQVLIQLLDQQYECLARMFLVVHMAPVFDRPVTVNPKHLFKAPLSPHNTGNVSYLCNAVADMVGPCPITSILDDPAKQKRGFGRLLQVRVINCQTTDTDMSCVLPTVYDVYMGGTPSGQPVTQLGTLLVVRPKQEQGVGSDSEVVESTAAGRNHKGKRKRALSLKKLLTPFKRSSSRTTSESSSDDQNESFDSTGSAHSSSSSAAFSNCTIGSVESSHCSSSSAGTCDEAYLSMDSGAMDVSAETQQNAEDTEMGYEVIPIEADCGSPVNEHAHVDSGVGRHVYMNTDFHSSPIRTQIPSPQDNGCGSFQFAEFCSETEKVKIRLTGQKCSQQQQDDDKDNEKDKETESIANTVRAIKEKMSRIKPKDREILAKIVADIQSDLSAVDGPCCSKTQKLAGTCQESASQCLSSSSMDLEGSKHAEKEQQIICVDCDSDMCTCVQAGVTQDQCDKCKGQCVCLLDCGCYKSMCNCSVFCSLDS